jgi:AcrR family transcriptional regulator
MASRTPKAPRERASGAALSTASRTKTWGYGEIQVADIVTAATEIVERVGVEGLTMRGLADELDISPMSIHYHVSNKQTLVDLVVENVLNMVEIPPAGTGPWDERLRQLFRNSRATMTRYPGVIEYTMTRPLSQREIALGDAITELLIEGGLGDTDTLRWTVQVMSNFALGAIVWERVRPSAADETVGSGSRESSNLFVEGFMDPAELVYQFGIDVIIAGLNALTERARATPPQSPSASPRPVTRSSSN